MKKILFIFGMIVFSFIISNVIAVDGLMEIIAPNWSVVESEPCPDVENSQCFVEYDFCEMYDWYIARFTVEGESAQINAFYCSCPEGQEICPYSIVKTDPDNPTCCLPGYKCINSICTVKEEECLAESTFGGYTCFFDGFYTRPFDCLGGVASYQNKGCCEGCVDGWDYNCWKDVVLY